MRHAAPHRLNRTVFWQLPTVFPKHQKNEDQFVKAGKVLGIGPFAIPGQGAMAIFTDKESAEEFVKNDPFVTEGLVTYTIKEWMDD